MPHLSNSSVMTTYLPLFLPTIEKDTKYCARFFFSNAKVETCYTELLKYKLQSLLQYQKLAQVS